MNNKNKSKGERVMKTYIVTYAPLTTYKHYSLQDLRTVRIFSELSKEEIKLAFEERCDVANSNMPTYQGVYVEVELLEDYLNNILSDII